jgi:hypothetical protein
MREEDIELALLALERDGHSKREEPESPEPMPPAYDESMQLPELDRQAWAITNGWKAEYGIRHRRMPRWGLVMKKFKLEKSKLEGRADRRFPFSFYRA